MTSIILFLSQFCTDFRSLSVAYNKIYKKACIKGVVLAQVYFFCVTTMKIAIIFVYILAIYLRSNVHADENTIVHTTYGDILGYQTDIARVFYGIPYAQPPINELRFEII